MDDTSASSPSSLYREQGAEYKYRQGLLLTAKPYYATKKSMQLTDSVFKDIPCAFPAARFPPSARKLQSGAARRPLPNDGSVTQEFRTLTSAGQACITDTNICSAHSPLPSRPLSLYLPRHRWVPMLFPKRLGFLHNTHVAHGIDHQTASTALGRVAPKGTTLPNQADSPTEAGSPDRSPHPKSRPESLTWPPRLPLRFRIAYLRVRGALRLL